MAPQFRPAATDARASRPVQTDARGSRAPGLFSAPLATGVQIEFSLGIALSMQANPPPTRKGLQMTIRKTIATAAIALAVVVGGSASAMAGGYDSYHNNHHGHHHHHHGHHGHKHHVKIVCYWAHHAKICYYL